MVVTGGVGNWTLGEMGILGGTFIHLLCDPGRVFLGFSFFFERVGIISAQKSFNLGLRPEVVDGSG